MTRLFSMTTTTMMTSLICILSLLDMTVSFGILSSPHSSMIPLVLRSQLHHQQYHYHQLLSSLSSSTKSSMIPKSLLVSTDTVTAIILPSDSTTTTITTATTMSSTLTSPWTFLADATDALTSSSGSSGSIWNMVENVALIVTALLFLLAGLTYITASVLIPAGAQQLEVECQQFIPDTWEKYLSQLETNQTIQDRPDLMFELGLLLNKAKADQLEKICTTTTTTNNNVNNDDYKELWDTYQAKLKSGQLLQDRPDLIQQLSMEVGQRAVTKIQNNCPPDLWQQYQTKLGPGQTMNQRLDLLQQLIEEPRYVAQFDVVTNQGIERLLDSTIPTTTTSTTTTTTTTKDNSLGSTFPAMSSSVKSQWDDEEDVDVVDK